MYLGGNRPWQPRPQGAKSKIVLIQKSKGCLVTSWLMGSWLYFSCTDTIKKLSPLNRQEKNL